MDAQNNVRDQIDTALTSIKQKRDELRLRLHLGGMEAKEKWQELEGLFAQAEHKAKEAGEAVVEWFRDLEGKFVSLGETLNSREPMAGGKGTNTPV